ncbi:hypothetical protein BUALT_Bualt03G0203500 [Buddleja alternifolia]|uniref:ATP-dependent DNA helicase n=1 Tax=Buddleja alternifolia TaxID=168488 RepID=A0AAV6Y695_9LAMI|nr:hypothetical protein BUALT_Bualt03G0203500 [Buddleja alternifolia]
MCQLLGRASSIVWDEAPMADKKAIETVDRTLREMLEIDLPFGGKVTILGGDFCQVVPVVVGGTRLQSVKASIVESYLWSNVKVLHLEENIRAQNDRNFSELLLRIGNGEEPVVQDDMVRIPDFMAIPWAGEHSIHRLIESVFPGLFSHTYGPEYMMDKAIITPLNEEVNKLNEKVIQLFQGEEEITSYSFDSVPEDMNNLYFTELLNSLTSSNLPPHKLVLKKGASIMLLRNIGPKIGLCNGTRLMCRRFGRNLIDAEVMCGQFKGTRVFLPATVATAAPKSKSTPGHAAPSLLAPPSSASPSLRICLSKMRLTAKLTIQNRMKRKYCCRDLLSLVEACLVFDRAEEDSNGGCDILLLISGVGRLTLRNMRVNQELWPQRDGVTKCDDMAAKKSDLDMTKKREEVAPLKVYHRRGNKQ